MMSSQERQASGPIRSLQNAETPTLQGPRERPPTGRFVVDQKHLAGRF
jgi:hypothetical protein